MSRKLRFASSSETPRSRPSPSALFFLLLNAQLWGALQPLRFESQPETVSAAMRAHGKMGFVVLGPHDARGKTIAHAKAAAFRTCPSNRFPV